MIHEHEILNFCLKWNISSIRDNDDIYMYVDGGASKTLDLVFGVWRKKEKLVDIYSCPILANDGNSIRLSRYTKTIYDCINMDAEFDRIRNEYISFKKQCRLEKISII